MTDLPDVKLKALISFPATVLDGTGIDVVKANGTYQFNLDFGDFAPPAAAITDSAQQNALLWNANTGAYALVPISVLLTGSTPSDALPLMDGVAAAGVSALYSRGDHKHPTDTTLATTAAMTAAISAAVTPLVETVKIQTFTASGTYTPSAGMLYCVIECVGGGASAGGATSSAGNSGASAGGGAGSYSRKIATAAAIGASQTVTIGAGGTAPSAGNNPGNAGGDTSVGAVCIGKGGSPSTGSGGASNTLAGGTGGIAGTGDFTPVGQPGGIGWSPGVNTIVGWGGIGGSGHWGGSGQPSSAVSGAGNAATGYGSGGGGAVSFNGGGAFAGGAGFSGVTLITEFCSQ